MSVKKLEEYINLIETAEKLSSAESRWTSCRGSIAPKKTPTDSRTERSFSVGPSHSTSSASRSNVDGDVFVPKLRLPPSVVDTRPATVPVDGKSHCSLSSYYLSDDCASSPATVRGHLAAARETAGTQTETAGLRGLVQTSTQTSPAKVRPRPALPPKFDVSPKKTLGRHTFPELSPSLNDLIEVGTKFKPAETKISRSNFSRDERQIEEKDGAIQDDQKRAVSSSPKKKFSFTFEEESQLHAGGEGQVCIDYEPKVTTLDSKSMTNRKVFDNESALKLKVTMTDEVKKKLEPVPPSPSKVSTLKAGMLANHKQKSICEDILNSFAQEKSGAGDAKDLVDKGVKFTSDENKLLSQSDKRKKIRPKSAPSVKKPEISSSKKIADLSGYSKSLKLLGIDIPTKGMQSSKLTHISVNISANPTMVTKLKEKSVSDLKDLVPKNGLTEEKFLEMKGKLSQAVYEEWYFRKAKDSKKKEKDEANSEKEVVDLEEKQKLVKEEFQKWLNVKDEELKLKKLKEAKQKRLVESKKNELKEKHKESFSKWKKEKLKKEKRQKEKALRKKKLKEQEKKAKEDEREEKKILAEKTFVAWKEREVEKRKEILRKEKEMQETKEAKKAENKKESELMFKAWKQRKDEILMQEKLKLARKQLDENKNKDIFVKTVFRDGKKVSVKMNEEERLKAAQHAYEEWLDAKENDIEDFDLADGDFRRSIRAPWYPAASCNY